MTAEILLWLQVIALGVLFGGALFEFRVLVHVWAGSPPGSVRSWNTDPRYALDPPRRFFAIVSPPLMLLAPLNAYFALQDAGAQRTWLLTSSVLTILVMVVTLAYFAPVMSALTLGRGEGLTDQAIVRQARTWVRLQYLRLVAVVLAWLCALQAFHVVSTP